MEDTRQYSTHFSPTNERQILEQIVNAILAAKSDLADATTRQWRQVIVESCRQQKLAIANTRLQLATT